MKRCTLVAPVILILMASLGLSGCGKEIPTSPQPPDSGETQAALDREFRLRLGQTALIEGTGFTISFTGVDEDSRCPKDVLCVRAGQATVTLAVARGGHDLGTINLTSPASDEFPGSQVIEAYILQLVNVEPYPESSHAISWQDYIVTLVVSQQ